MRHQATTAALMLLVLGVPLMAQPPASPPPEVTRRASGNVNLGVALTSGNKDTSTFNAGYEFKYDPKTKNVVKSTGLLLFGKTEGEKTAEQYGLTLRDEYTFNTRAFVYGDFRYLHDRFKGINYLVSPTAGGGYKVVDTPATQLALSAGAGFVSEEDYGFDLRTSGAVTFDEKFTHQLTATATTGQTISALWKTSDFGDALYGFGLNLAASITSQAQLKIELLDTYKTKPPDPALKKNDVVLIMSVVYKF
jgi:putative salt-induced outer membrane protein YdiY